MAFFELHYHSDALKMGVSVNVILPEKAKKSLIGMSSAASDAPTYKTLFLLHGLSDDHTIWMRRTSIERYATKAGIAVVMPAVARSWYTDTADGAHYLTFITEELPDVCRGYFRGMSDKREDTFIAGLSMGGYGAVKASLVRPERFGACASLSGALDIAGFANRSMNNEWRGIFGFGLESAAELKDTEHDIFALVKKNAEGGLPFPKLYMWCGLDDELIDSNRRFDSLLTEKGIEHVYAESEGDHSWEWWDRHIQDAINYFIC